MAELEEEEGYLFCWAGFEDRWTSHYHYVETDGVTVKNSGSQGAIVGAPVYMGVIVYPLSAEAKGAGCILPTNWELAYIERDYNGSTVP
jgi:hypothetical protein